MKCAATIIIPTLNEAETIVEIIEKIYAIKPEHHEYQIIVVDDGSTDGTEDKVRTLMKNYALDIIQRGQRLGLSSAVREGAHKATTDWIVVIDADGSHPAEKIPELLEKNISGEADLVIGSRHVEGGKISGWPLKRQLLSRYGTLLSSMLTNVFDPLSGFFSCSREVLLKYGMGAQGYKILLELLTQVPAAVKVVELPIHFIDRQKGQSKMSMAVQIQFFSQLLRLFIDKLNCHPFKAQLLGYSSILFFDFLISFMFLVLAQLPVQSAHQVGFTLFTFFSIFYVLYHHSTKHFFGPHRYYSLIVFLLVLSFSYSFRVAMVHYCFMFGMESEKLILLLCCVAGSVIFLKSLVLCHLLAPPEKSHHTHEVKFMLQAIVLLVFIFSAKFLYLALMDLIPQEALHWNRAMRLAPAFVDHPGGVAALIRSAVVIFGSNEFAVRIGAFICGIMTTFFVYGIGYRLSGQKITGYLSALTLNICPFFWGVGFFNFPDSPLITMCAGSLYFGLRALQEQRWHFWSLAGVFLGLAMMSKYTAIFIFGSLGLFFIAEKEGRKLLNSKTPYIVFISALITMSPLLIFEAGRGWLTFKYQFLRRMTHSFWGFPTYVGSLMGELSPVFLIFVLVILVLMLKRWKTRDIGQRFLLYASLPPLLAFAIYSQWNLVKFSWPAPVFIALIPLVTHYTQQHPNAFPRLKSCAYAILMLFFIIMVFLFPISLSFDLSFTPFSIIPDVVAWRDLDRPIQALREKIHEQTGKSPFIIGLDKYDLAAEVSFYSSLDLAEVTSRNAIGGDGLTWNVWSNLQKYEGRPAILLSNKIRYLNVPEMANHFNETTALSQMTITSGKQRQILYYHIGYGYHQ